MVSYQSQQQGSSLARSLRRGEQRLPLKRQPIYTLPGQVEVMGLMTQAKLDRRPVILPCIVTGIDGVLVISVTHDSRTENFDWAVYIAESVDGNNSRILSRYRNASPFNIVANIESLVTNERGTSQSSSYRSNKLPLFGEMLLSSGVITGDALAAALNLQKSPVMTSKKLGEILALSGATNNRVVEITAVLQEQIKAGRLDTAQSCILLSTAVRNGWTAQDMSIQMQNRSAY